MSCPSYQRRIQDLERFRGLKLMSKLGLQEWNAQGKYLSSYCFSQKSRVEFIPQAKIKVLYLLYIIIIWIRDWFISQMMHKPMAVPRTAWRPSGWTKFLEGLWTSFATTGCHLGLHWWRWSQKWPPLLLRSLQGKGHSGSHPEEFWFVRTWLQEIVIAQPEFEKWWQNHNRKSYIYIYI